jgi:hypothetical protein
LFLLNFVWLVALLVKHRNLCRASSVVQHSFHRPCGLVVAPAPFSLERLTLSTPCIGVGRYSICGRVLVPTEARGTRRSLLFGGCSAFVLSWDLVTRHKHYRHEAKPHPRLL